METMTEIFDDEGGDKGSFFCHVGQDENLAHLEIASHDPRGM